MLRKIIERGFIAAWLVLAILECGAIGFCIYVVGLLFGYTILARPEFEEMKAAAEKSLKIAKRWEDYFKEQDKCQ